ncbi:lipocalin [Bizionia sediminis]|uniref:Lipocalin n=1 Tax=Bizionia sediminis TaxID=1737064 RepID=A0ABW5KS12_9FLAO
MKHILLLLVTASFFACSSTKAIKDSKKELKGNWTLTAINYSQTGQFNVTLFNDVSANCFQGSTWSFVPNNHTGTYNITNSNCAQGLRYFNFQIQEVNSENGLYDFLIKTTNAKGKSDNNSGYRLQLAGISETTMQWRQTVDLNGSPFTIFMTFTKQ